MASNYTPTPVYHATIAEPDDGDPAIAASANSPLSDLADGLCYIAEPFAVGGTVALGGDLTLSGNAIVFDLTDTSFGGNAVFGANPGNTFNVNSTAAFNANTSLGSSAADTIQVNGTLSVIGNATFGVNGGNQLSVISSATFSNNVTFAGSVTSSFALETDGTFTANGTATFNGNVQIGDDSSDGLDVYATTVFRGLVTIGNDSGSEGFTVNSPTNFEDTVEFNANVEIGSSSTTLEVNAVTTFRSDVTIGNSTSDDIVISGALTIDSLTAPMGFGTNGRVPMQPVQLPNSNESYTTADGNLFYLAGTTLTTARTYTFSDTGAVDGDCVMFCSRDAAFDVDFNFPGGLSADTTIPAAGDKFVVWVRNGGSWVLATRVVA